MTATITAEEHWTTKGEDVRLFLWRKYAGSADGRPAILFVHGSSMASQPTFDLQVPGRPWSSAMEFFAARGLDNSCVDMRPEIPARAATHAPAVRIQVLIGHFGSVRGPAEFRPTRRLTSPIRSCAAGDAHGHDPQEQRWLSPASRCRCITMLRSGRKFARRIGEAVLLPIGLSVPTVLSLKIATFANSGAAFAIGFARVSGVIGRRHAAVPPESWPGQPGRAGGTRQTADIAGPRAPAAAPGGRAVPADSLACTGVSEAAGRRTTGRRSRHAAGRLSVTVIDGAEALRPRSRGVSGRRGEARGAGAGGARHRVRQAARAGRQADRERQVGRCAGRL